MTELELFPANVTVQLPEPGDLDGELSHVELTDDGVIELHAEHNKGEPQPLAQIAHPAGGRFSGVEIKQVADHYGLGNPRWPLTERQQEAARSGEDPYSRPYWPRTPHWMRYWRSLTDEQQAATQTAIDDRSALVERIVGGRRPGDHTGYFTTLVEDYRLSRGLPRADWLVPADQLPSLESQAERVRRGLGPTEARIMLDVTRHGGIEQPDLDSSYRWELERFNDDASMVRQLALRELVAPPANPNDVKLTELGQAVGDILLAEHAQRERSRSQSASS